MPISDKTASRFTEAIANVSAQDLFDQRNEQNLIDFGNAQAAGSAQGASNARASRTSALKQLTIQRKKLEFQKLTGLRDIGQARTEGLKGAINNALQRGIFNSGIRQANEAEVNREANEARDDLKTNIQFALDDLAARREGVGAQRFGAGGGLTPPIPIDVAAQNAVDEAAQQRQDLTTDFIAPANTTLPPNTNLPPSSGVVPIAQPGGPS